MTKNDTKAYGKVLISSHIPSKFNCLNEVHKIGYFIQRDLKLSLSYKIAFITMFSSMIFNLFSLVFFGAMFDIDSVSSLSFYGGNYISYVLIGTIGWGFMWGIASSTSTALRSEMSMGTLESIMLTPTKLTILVISYLVFGCIFSLISVLLMAVTGILLFGVSILGTISIWTVVIVLTMTFCMGGLGMLFGGLTVWSKNIGHTITLVQGVTMFFAGVYFPLTILPNILRPIASVLPFFYYVEGLRRSLIPGTPDILFFVAINIIFGVILTLIGYFVLQYGIRKAKMDGSLSHY